MRVFIAIEIAEQIKEKIICVQNKLKASNILANWTKKENFHLTLKFLGEISETQLISVIKITEETSSKLMSFYFEIGEIGVFPHINHPQVIWVGILQGNEKILEYQNLLNTNLAKLGFEKEKRKFHPHFTLARIKSSKNLAKLITIIEDISPKILLGKMKFSVIKIMQSTLTPTGSIYTVLKEVELKKIL